MIETSETMTNVKGNKSIVFTVGATQFTVLPGDTKRIFAKATLAHVIEDPILVQRVLAKHGL